MRIYRVDNPHTKAFHFWEWAIADVRRQYPDVIFLAEAFTRPNIMRYLAKIGFDQSYSYFTWRNGRDELREYFTELSQTESREYMRPNLFANTPDILHEFLQHGGPGAFRIRLVLAATLGSTYGIYSGYELCENVPIRPGSEEYLDSEKYQIRVRNWDAQGNIKPLIARMNEIRRTHPALQNDRSLRFFATDSPSLLCYAKSTRDRKDVVLVVVSLDPHHVQQGFVQAPAWELAVNQGGTYQVEELLTGTTYTWRGEWNYVRLTPDLPAHVLRLHSQTRRGPGVSDSLPILGVSSIDEVFEGGTRDRLEREILTAYLPRQRWFSSKARSLIGTRVLDHGPIGDRPLPVLTIVLVEYDDGGSERYSVPLSVVTGAATASLLRMPPPAAAIAWLDSAGGCAARRCLGRQRVLRSHRRGARRCLAPHDG